MTVRELLGLGLPATEAERRQTIPMWWTVLSTVLAWAFERLVEANVAHHRNLMGAGAFVLAMTLICAPGWLLVLHVRGRRHQDQTRATHGDGSSDASE